MKESKIRPVARIRSDFTSKFGIPRQAGILRTLEAEIIFEPEFSDREAVRGIEGFSHLWLIWQFSENIDAGWSPTVRPPRLGGNERVGVFATRSPYRPNALGLSCVKLLSVEDTGKGMPVLKIAGADLMDGTPIFDIKPYLPYADCIPEATGGFAPDSGKRMPVQFRGDIAGLSEEEKKKITEVLSLDPRPQYKKAGEKEYRFEMAGMRISFIAEETGLTVTKIEKLK